MHECIQENTTKIYMYGGGLKIANYRYDVFV